MMEQEQLRVRRSGSGFCAEGRGYYVWDEDPRIVADTIQSLAIGGSGTARRVLRMCRSHAQTGTGTGSGNGEALDD